MASGTRRLVGQLVVLVPVLLFSAFLGSRGVPLVPRILSALGLGMFLIALVAIWQRRRK
ncbi:MAG TPA: hypothetical protein VGJ84_08805 [Polyangiaceae bacterium]